MCSIHFLKEVNVLFLTKFFNSVYACVKLFHGTKNPRGSQVMIRVYEDLNLGIFFWDFGTFLWDFGTFFEISGLFWDFGTF